MVKKNRTRAKKDFDCVEMKREAQAALMAEYEARKHEFRSYWEFLRKTAGESAWEREMIAKLSEAGSRT